MTIIRKPWARLGLGLALAGATLTACGETGEAGETGETGEGGAVIAGEMGEGGESGSVSGEMGEGGEAGEMGEGEGEGEGEAGHAAALPIENRVAFMSGHVAAGLALYRAGAPDQAAPHLLHPVSETHEAERAGLAELGFDASLFETVSAALEAGEPAESVAPQLDAAEANMAAVQANAGGDPAAVIAYLMDTVFDEYRVGVTEGVITDPGEYQDAYGFTVVALDIAQTLESDAAAAVVTEIETLLALWPELGPLADSTPAAVSDVVAQTSKVHLALADLDG